MHLKTLEQIKYLFDLQSDNSSQCNGYRLLCKEIENVKGNGINTNDSILLYDLEEFFFEMGEDWHLWDEQEKGTYPITRTFDAFKKFIDHHKSKNNETR